MNGKLNLYPRQTEDEWSILQKIAARRNKDGVTHLLRGEIVRKFSSIELECESVKSKKIVKHLELDLPFATIKDILCQADALGIGPIELISRVIIFPLLSESSVAGTGNSI